MVTINGARAVRWDDQVGSIETGKAADLIVMSDPLVRARPDLPPSPYRSLIDATEADVALVLVNGEPVAGDVSTMQSLKPGDFDTVRSESACFVRAIDVTRPGLPKGTETLTAITTAITDGLRAMGGDHPPAGGAPATHSKEDALANALGTIILTQRARASKGFP